MHFHSREGKGRCLNLRAGNDILYSWTTPSLWTRQCSYGEHLGQYWWGHWRSPKDIYWADASIARTLCGTGIWWYCAYLVEQAVLYNHTWWGWAKATVNSGIIFRGLLYSPTGILVSDTEIFDKYKITMHFLSKKRRKSTEKTLNMVSLIPLCFITYYNVPKQLLWVFK